MHDLGVTVEKYWIQPHLVPLNYLEYRPVPGGFCLQKYFSVGNTPPDPQSSEAKDKARSTHKRFTGHVMADITRGNTSREGYAARGLDPVSTEICQCRPITPLPMAMGGPQPPRAPRDPPWPIYTPRGGIYPQSDPCITLSSQ